MFYIETYYDADFGTVAIMYDTYGDIVATGYDPALPRSEDDELQESAH